MIKFLQILIPMTLVVSGCSKQTVTNIGGNQMSLVVPAQGRQDQEDKVEDKLNETLNVNSAKSKEEAVYLLAIRNIVSRYENDPRSAEMVIKLGNFYFDRARYHRAIEIYSIVINDHQNSAVYMDAVKNTALAYARNGDFKNAGSWYAKLKSISASTRSEDNQSIAAGNLYRKASEFEQAEEFNKAGLIYLEVAGKYSDYEIAPRAMINAALMLEKTENYKSANKIYQKFMQKFPDSPLLAEVYLRDADCWQKRGLHMTAAKKYINLAKLFPSARLSESALYRAGQAFQQAGEEVVAARSFERYWELYPKGADACEALKNAGAIYKSMNDTEKEEYINQLFIRNCGKGSGSNHD